MKTCSVTGVEIDVATGQSSVRAGISRVCVGVVFLSLISLLSACGGGGGGGGGNGSTGGGSDDARGVRVLHASIDAAPVDLLSSAAASPVVTQIRFAGSRGYRRVPSGAQVLSLTRAFSPSQVVESFNVDVQPSDQYSILMYGDNQTFGVRAKLLKDEVPSDITGAAVRLVNGVTGASAVNFSAAVGATVAVQSQVSFGDASDYLRIGSAGELILSASRSADGRIVARSTVQLAEGGCYTFFVAGEVSYYTKGILFRDR